MIFFKKLNKKPTFEQFSAIPLQSKVAIEFTCCSPTSTFQDPCSPSVLLWRHFRTAMQNKFQNTKTHPMY